MDKLKQSVCSTELAHQEAALIRADIAVSMKFALTDLIANPDNELVGKKWTLS